MTEHNSTNDSGEQATDQAEPTAAAPGAELVTYDNERGALVVPTPIAGHVLEFTREQHTLTPAQMHLLAPIGVEADWDPTQVGVFLMLCQQRGFDPWAKEAYLMLVAGKYVQHIGIGGLRRKAEETGEYVGRVGPQWCGPDGVWRDVWLDRNTPPAAARVGILRRGFDGPVWGIATFDEYAPMVEEAVWSDHPTEMKNGRPKRVKTSTGRRVPAAGWKPAAEGGKPSVMLAKCAEAAGLRAAFPSKFSGFYVPEELEKVHAEHATKTGATPAADPGRERRQAAYAEAMNAAANTGPAPLFVGLGVSDDDARRLLLAELDEQGVILEKSRGDMTARWSAARGGLPVERWELRDIVRLVHKVRPLVLDALREQGRDVEADQYMRAAPVGDVETLFGRTPVVIDGAEVTETEPVGANA